MAAKGLLLMHPSTCSEELDLRFGCRRLCCPSAGTAPRFGLCSCSLIAMPGSFIPDGLLAQAQIEILAGCWLQKVLASQSNINSPRCQQGQPCWCFDPRFRTLHILGSRRFARPKAQCRCLHPTQTVQMTRQLHHQPASAGNCKLWAEQTDPCARGIVHCSRLPLPSKGASV